MIVHPKNNINQHRNSKQRSLWGSTSDVLDAFGGMLYIAVIAEDLKEHR